MSTEIAWVILRKNGAEEARHASGQNFAVVLAADPDAARKKATAANRFGESYMDRRGYAVVSLDAFMREMDGTALIRGDLPNPITWPEGTPYVF